MYRVQHIYRSWRFIDPHTEDERHLAVRDHSIVNGLRLVMEEIVFVSGSHIGCQVSGTRFNQTLSEPQCWWEGWTNLEESLGNDGGL